MTPVLSDIPPFRNLLEQSGAGLLLSAQNPEQNISRLLALHEEMQINYTQRRAQMQQFVERYNWRHIAEKYIDIYKELVR